MILILVIAGLLIGVLIGYQDISVLYESVRKNKPERSYLALAIIAIAIFFGVVINRGGSSVFVAEMAKINDLKTGAIISLSALLVTLFMRRKFMIISISHALIGSIVGWLLFIGYEFPFDKILYIIVVWLLSPILSFFIASWILTISTKLIKNSHIHIFKMDLIFKQLTMLAMVVAAFSLGANNSANIAGVFLLPISEMNVEVLNWNISAELALFILAAISLIIGFIASQVIPAKKRSNLIFEFSTEANFSVLLSYGIVFFIFSSRSFQELLSFAGFSGYDLVPISTFHVLTAGIVGISYKKGYNIYNKEAMIKLPMNSLLTPLISGLTTFVILIIINSIFEFSNPITDNLFKSKALIEGESILTITDWRIVYYIVVIIVFIVLILLGYFIYSRMQKRLILERRLVEKQAFTLEAEKEIFVEELKYANKAGVRLKKEIDLKTAELEKFALQLVEKEKMLTQLKKVLKLLKQATGEAERDEVINEINIMITESLNLAKERELFYSSVSNVNADFFIRLSQQFTNLTESDKRLIALIKLGLSSKEIASLSNITPKSVEMNRYRLRKKLNLPPDLELSIFVAQI